VFDYYYDNKAPEYGIHGGMNPDSLLNFYTRFDSMYFSNYHSRVFRFLKIPENARRKYLDSDGNLALPENLQRSIPDSIYNIPFPLPMENFGALFTPIPFDRIKPREFLSVYLSGYPAMSMENLEHITFDEKWDDVFYWKRNYIFSKLKSQ
jgi:hypothetical protein